MFSPDAPAWLREIPAVILLGRVWLQNFQIASIDDGSGTRNDADHTKLQTTRVVWRTSAEGIPPSLLMIASPYDPETHYARKRTTTWIGYKVHLTETCDADRPRLITHVATTLAPVADRDALGSIHADLAAHDLLPNTHLVDAGYIDADLLLARRPGDHPSPASSAKRLETLHSPAVSEIRQSQTWQNIVSTTLPGS